MLKNKDRIKKTIDKIKGKQDSGVSQSLSTSPFAILDSGKLATCFAALNNVNSSLSVLWWHQKIDRMEPKSLTYWV